MGPAIKAQVPGPGQVARVSHVREKVTILTTRGVRGRFARIGLENDIAALRGEIDGAILSDGSNGHPLKGIGNLLGL